MERYQTFVRRIVASILDTLFIYTPIAAFYFWTGFTETEPSAETEAAVNLGSAILGICYVVLFHWVFGQTLGKMAAKVRVVEVVSEGNILFVHACVRDVFYILEGLLRFSTYGYLFFLGLSLKDEPAVSMEFYVPIVFVAWDFVNAVVCIKHPKNRAVHDMIAGTVVVRLDVRDERIEDRYLDPPSPDAYEDIGEARQ